MIPKWLESELEKKLFELVLRRGQEMKTYGLTGRLIIDFQRGILNTVQDQAIISGTTITSYYLDKI